MIKVTNWRASNRGPEVVYLAEQFVAEMFRAETGDHTVILMHRGREWEVAETPEQIHALAHGALGG